MVPCLDCTHPIYDRDVPCPKCGSTTHLRIKTYQFRSADRSAETQTNLLLLAVGFLVVALIYLIGFGILSGGRGGFGLFSPTGPPPSPRPATSPPVATPPAATP